MKNASIAILVAVALIASAQTPADHAHSDMEYRGNQGMGFAQDSTTHHFLLEKDGGAIQVTAKSPDSDRGQRRSRSNAPVAH